MTFQRIQRKKGTENHKTLSGAYQKIESIIEALDQKTIPERELISINDRVEKINSFNGSDKDLVKLLKKSYREILTLLDEQLNLVLKHHFRAQWLFYGTIAGAALTTVVTSVGWTTLNGLGSLVLPLVVAAGIVIGIAMDNNARISGRQIEIEADEY